MTTPKAPETPTTDGGGWFTPRPMSVTMYGVPPTMGPRDEGASGRLIPWPWLPAETAAGTDGTTEPPGAERSVASAVEAVALVKRVADALSALRLAEEITRPEHRALLDLCAGDLRHAVEMLEGGR